MSTVVVDSVASKSGAPVNFPNGLTIGEGGKFGNINFIGLAGQQGFGVGICPAIPANFAKMPGTDDIASDNYGNYQYSDGSVMVWMPAFYYKYGTGSNGLAINDVDIKGFYDYENVASANAAGYALHRAFYNGGAIQLGVFVDKYLCSDNGGIASSIKLGNPLSSNSAHNPFSLVGAANFYYGAIDAAKSRGSDFFCNTQFIFKALALLSLAHGQAASSIASCAWYDAGGITNFPKGCNDNALGDTNDGDLSFISDGYSNAAKTGSANLFARTTHNGMNSGVCDLNGSMWEIALGLTADATNFYLLSTATDVKTITSGAALATDAWGATGLAAMYDDLGVTYESLENTVANRSFGGVTQVLSEATSSIDWSAAGAGIPLLAGIGGTNQFGNDYMYDKRPDTMCPLLGGSWAHAASAGVWALGLSNVRSTSGYGVGLRAALYL